MASSKGIEEKALNYLRNFLEDSESLSQFLTENDKEPCWDGAIYVYSKGKKDIKEYLIGRIPSQVKGVEVSHISNSCKYRIGVSNLRAYLHDPTLFVVCQIQKGGCDRKLFYQFLLPETIKYILKGKSSQNTIMVQLLPMPNLSVFEDEAMIFLGDREMQLSFANKKTISMNDVIARGIKDFSFITPRKMEPMALMKYMSSHFSFLYAKIDNELNIEVPIYEGPAKFTFEEELPLTVSVKGRVFYDSCCKKIENGICTISAGKVMTIICPLEAVQNSLTIKFNSKSELLDERIKDEEFVLAVLESKHISIGDYEFEVNVGENIEKLRNIINDLKNIKKLLEKLHVKKPLLLNTIKDDQWETIKILIETIINKNLVKLHVKESTLIKAEIGNLQILVWCVVNKDGYCMIGDFFDGTCDSIYQESRHGKIQAKATVYSFLRDNKLWEIIDNIDFEQIIPKTNSLKGKHEYVFEIANQDILSMISAADNLTDKDSDKSKTLLSKAKDLALWCQENDVSDNKITYRLNVLQIVKRERLLNDEEKKELIILSDSKSEAPINRLAASMLLEDKERYTTLKTLVNQDEIEFLKNTPIGKFLLD